jgi:hypothetical protein
MSCELDGVISDGQQSIRKAVEVALPGTAHGLWSFRFVEWLNHNRDVFAAYKASLNFVWA